MAFNILKKMKTNLTLHLTKKDYNIFTIPNMKV